MPCRWARQRPGALCRPSVLQRKTLMPGRFTHPGQIKIRAPAPPRGAGNRPCGGGAEPVPDRRAGEKAGPAAVGAHSVRPEGFLFRLRATYFCRWANVGKSQLGDAHGHLQCPTPRSPRPPITGEAASEFKKKASNHQLRPPGSLLRTCDRTAVPAPAAGRAIWSLCRRHRGVRTSPPPGGETCRDRTRFAFHTKETTNIV